jgi:hypothetical protein
MITPVQIQQDKTTRAAQHGNACKTTGTRTTTRIRISSRDHDSNPCTGLSKQDNRHEDGNVAKACQTASKKYPATIHISNTQPSECPSDEAKESSDEASKALQMRQMKVLQMGQKSPQDETNQSPQDEAIENLSDEAMKIVLQVRSKDKSHLILKGIEKEREERCEYARLHFGIPPPQITSLGATQQI